MTLCGLRSHVMYLQNISSYTTLMFSQLEVVWTAFACYVPSKYFLLHDFNVFPTWSCADCFGMILAVCRKGLGAGWWPFTGIDPSGSWDHKKVLCSNPMMCRWNSRHWNYRHTNSCHRNSRKETPARNSRHWNSGNELDLGVGAHGLSGWVCCYLPSIYTHILFFHL